MKSIVFGIKNRKLFLLVGILLVSTLIGTVIQFAKGSFFQGALDQDTNAIYKYGIIFGVLIVAEILFYYIEWTFQNRLINNTFAKQKKGIIKKALRTKLFNRDENKDTLNNLTNVVDSLDMLYYRSFFDTIYLSFRVIFVTISLLFINVYIGVLVFVFMFVPLIITKLFKRKLAQLEEKYLNQKGINLKFFTNILSNLKYIRILNADRLFFNRTKSYIDKEKETGIKTEQYKITLNTLYSSISYLSHFLILVIAIILIIRGDINPGITITLLGLVEQLSLPILSLSRNINNINSTKGIRSDIEKNMDYIDQPNDIQIEFKDAIKTKDLALDVDRSILNYSDITIFKNSKHIITGESGLGKSVFIDSLLGLRDRDHGKVLYDNIELDTNSNPFNDAMYVLTDNVLFDGTPIFNILFRDDYSEDELIYMEKFISRKKLMHSDTSKLSSGEKRRVLLLRGLMSDKTTLIFDEPTSNLDELNSLIFWDELMSIQNKTIVVISHNTPRNIYESFDYKFDFNEIVERKAIDGD